MAQIVPHQIFLYDLKNKTRLLDFRKDRPLDTYFRYAIDETLIAIVCRTRDEKEDDPGRVQILNVFSKSTGLPIASGMSRK